MIVRASDLKRAHWALLHRESVGLLREEQDLLEATSRGETFLSSLDQVGAFFEVDRTALRRWRQWDDHGVLDAGPYCVADVERLRSKIIGVGQRYHPRQSDMWARLRRRNGM